MAYMSLCPLANDKIINSVQQGNRQDLADTTGTVKKKLKEIQRSLPDIFSKVGR